MKWLSFIAWIVGPCMLAIAAICAWTAWTKSQLLFNSEGRYFDSFEVHLEQSVLGYSIVALAIALVGTGCIWAAYRFRR